MMSHLWPPPSRHEMYVIMVEKLRPAVAVLRMKGNNYAHTPWFTTSSLVALKQAALAVRCKWQGRRSLCVSVQSCSFNGCCLQAKAVKGIGRYSTPGRQHGLPGQCQPNSPGTLQSPNSGMLCRLAHHRAALHRHARHWQTPQGSEHNSTCSCRLTDRPHLGTPTSPQAASPLDIATAMTQQPAGAISTEPYLHTAYIDGMKQTQPTINGQITHVNWADWDHCCQIQWQKQATRRHGPRVEYQEFNADDAADFCLRDNASTQWCARLTSVH